MKMYQTPIVEVELLKGISMLMEVTGSPSDDIQGTPTELNNPSMAPGRLFY